MKDAIPLVGVTCHAHKMKQLPEIAHHHKGYLIRRLMLFSLHLFAAETLTDAVMQKDVEQRVALVVPSVVERETVVEMEVTIFLVAAEENAGLALTCWADELEPETLANAEMMVAEESLFGESVMVKSEVADMGTRVLTDLQGLVEMRAIVADDDVGFVSQTEGLETSYLNCLYKTAPVIQYPGRID